MITTVALRLLVALQSMLPDARDENGQTLAEYSLIISVIAIGAVLLGMIVFRDALAGAFNRASACLNSSC